MVLFLLVINFVFLEEMPNTVTVLDTPDGGKVYLIGTAHFSIKSQEDVSRVSNFIKS